MNKDQIKKYLEELNEALRLVDAKGEICLYGGAVMCLVYDARPATRDVDAVFKPTQIIRQAIRRVAEAKAPFAFGGYECLRLHANRICLRGLRTAGGVNPQDPGPNAVRSGGRISDERAKEFEDAN